MKIEAHPASIVIGALVLAAAAAFVGFWWARHTEASPMTVTAAGQKRSPLYWYDPMVPNQHFGEPGKSPFMEMQLIPKYPDSASGDAEGEGVKVDPRELQNLGVRLTTVVRAPLAQSIEAVGTLGFNQRDVAVIQARSAAFVSHLYTRAPGDLVERNTPIADLLVPEWVGAQTEFVALLNSHDPALIDAARQRLSLLGMTPEIVAGVERRREPRATITIRSPLAGVIETLDVREGMTLSSGATLARINGLATVWLEAAIPEARGGFASVGEQVRAQLTAYPGEHFTGRVIAVLPQASTETHTLRVRIELPNTGGRLRPGMFAQVRFARTDNEPVLYVASEALIHTGARTIAIVAGEQGRFIPTVVSPGFESDGKTVILAGLTQGQRVVASGQFLIDSEANLAGALARLGAGSAESGRSGEMPEARP